MDPRTAPGRSPLSFGDRVRYTWQENQKLSAARNSGVALATGDWVAMLDHDDLFMPDKLEKQAAAIEANPNLVLVYSGFTFLYLDGSTKEMPPFPADKLWPALRYRTPILPSTTVIKRSALLEIGGFRSVPEVYKIEDWDTWFRLISRFSKDAFYCVPKSLLMYRDLPNSESKSFMLMSVNVLHMLDTRLLGDLTGWKKAIWKRQSEARIFYHVAVALRSVNNERYWEFAIESFLSWPFWGTVVQFHRYSVFLHMLMKKLAGFRFNFRYWWPKRRCHDFESYASS